MPIFRLTEEVLFPSPQYSEPDGLLAVGGDLTLDRLLLAYYEGIFPWYSDNDPILWWSPDPRFVLFPEKLKTSKSLQRTIKKNKFHIRIDQNFETVIRNCSKTPRKGQQGTWITESMIKAYYYLHKSGYAHSFEAYEEDQLVGGLYGVSLGKCFFGESMFTHKTDASKVAFTFMVNFLKDRDYKLVDCQVYTKHLESLGAEEIGRTDFLSYLAQYRDLETWVGRWS